jgi:DNA replication protein DnaC
LRSSANVINARPLWSSRNLPFNEWTEILGSERLTGALLDRLTHHVHILEMNGESYRLKESNQTKAGKARV